jgi:hypothetical protein
MPQDSQIYGFETSQGSLYVRDPEGLTLRFKGSPGEGHGQWQNLGGRLSVSHCLYVPDLPAEFRNIGVNRIMLGYVNPSTNTFTRFRVNQNFDPEPMIIPQDSYPAIRVQNRASGAVIGTINAELQPRLGLTPVEKTYGINNQGENVSINHAGNPITVIHTDLGDMKKAAEARGTELILPGVYREEYRSRFGGIAGLVAPIAVGAAATAGTWLATGSPAQAKESGFNAGEDTANILGLREDPQGAKTGLGRAAYKAMDYVEQKGNEISNALHFESYKPIDPKLKAEMAKWPSAPMAKP